MHELADLRPKEDLQEYFTYLEEKSGLDCIFIKLHGVKDTAYAGEHFELLIEPAAEHPFEAPKVCNYFSVSFSLFQLYLFKLHIRVSVLK